MRRSAPTFIAFAAALALGPTAVAQAPAGPNIFADTILDPLILPRATVRRDFGDGVGYRNGYTYLEGFVPVLQSSDSLQFANVRVLNFDQWQYWEAQLGGGSRWILPNQPIILGVNGFYDGRNTSYHWFNQAGVGWEVLGRIWEARGNVYIPFGQQRVATGTAFRDPFFIGTNIGINQATTYQTAMGGVDAEVGRRYCGPFCCARNYAYLGYYHYSGTGVRQVDGIRGRLESWFGENVSANFQIQHDEVFQTTVTGGVSLHYGGVSSLLRRSDPLQAKLGNRVVRDPNVVLQTTTDTKPQLLIDPQTGKPIEVRHANSTAGTAGDGTVEHPYQNLSLLQSGSGPGMILFLHAGSTFSKQNIVLQDGQRLLGEGIPHLVVAQQGTFLLPRATHNVGMPIIADSAATAIVLANNTEVSGIRIVRPFGAGVSGTDIANINVNRNVIEAIVGSEDEGTNATGVSLRNVTGASFIRDNVISTDKDNGFVGIDVTLDGTSTATMFITGNQISTPFGGTGIAIFADQNANVRASIVGNSFLSSPLSSSTGIGLLTSGSATGIFQVVGNNTPNTANDFMSFSSSFFGLQLANNNAFGYFLGRFPGSTFQYEDLLPTNTGPATTLGAPIPVSPGTFFPPPP